MSLLNMLFGNSTTIISGRDAEFSWNTAGTGTRYLLVTYVDGEIQLDAFHTSAKSRAELLAALQTIEAGTPAKLIGIETREVVSEVYDLDLDFAKQRLKSDLAQ